METLSICCGLILCPLLIAGWLAGSKLAGFSKKVRNIGLGLICLPFLLAAVTMSKLFFVDDAFLDACADGNLPAVKSYIEHGVSPDVEDEGNTPLGAAIGAGREEVALYLLDHGADPNHRCFDSTPLHLAKEIGLEKVVQALKKKGAH